MAETPKDAKARIYEKLPQKMKEMFDAMTPEEQAKFVEDMVTKDPEVLPAVDELPVAAKGEIVGRLGSQVVVLEVSFLKISKAEQIIGGDWLKLLKAITNGSLPLTVSDLGMFFLVTAKSPKLKNGEEWARLVMAEGIASCLPILGDYIGYVIQGDSSKN